MLPSELLIYRYNGDEVAPKRLEGNKRHLGLARDVTEVFQSSVGLKRKELDERLQALEGESTDYRVKRGLAHILVNSFSTFEVVSPLEPEALRAQVFAVSASRVASRHEKDQTLTEVAESLTRELERETSLEQVRQGLYADLPENYLLVSFDAPPPERLLHRYNLAQAQGILYRANKVVLTAHRNIPTQYKLLFKYLKLFRLMTYIEGDSDHGFTITVDGPTSLFKSSTRYGLDMAKLLPALLHVTQWSMSVDLSPSASYDDAPKAASFSLDSSCGLVSHYPKGKPFDSIVEQAFAERWEETKTDWQLEREVELVPLPGSVMIPDFRLVHPDGRSFILEIVGYWRADYLKKKFAQVRRSGRDDIVLLISERLNLEGAGVKLESVPARVVWFKGKVNPKDVLASIE